MAVKPKRLLADLEQHLNILDKLPFALFQLNKRLKVVWANLEANELVGTNPVDAPVEERYRYRYREAMGGSVPVQPQKPCTAQVCARAA